VKNLKTIPVDTQSQPYLFFKSIVKKYSPLLLILLLIFKK
jgi:hypothetical protein